MTKYTIGNLIQCGCNMDGHKYDKNVSVNGKKYYIKVDDSFIYADYENIYVRDEQLGNNIVEQITNAMLDYVNCSLKMNELDLLENWDGIIEYKI